MTRFTPARGDRVSRRRREMKGLNATTQLDEEDTWLGVDSGRRQFLQ